MLLALANSKLIRREGARQSMIILALFLAFKFTIKISETAANGAPVNIVLVASEIRAVSIASTTPYSN